MTDSQTLAHTRQLDWFNPADHKDTHVTIVGVGGIGSFTAFALAKLGVHNLTLIDPDRVEAHNIPNQMFDPEQVGKLKVNAMKDKLHYIYPECNVFELAFALEDCSGLLGIVIGALDSMEARSELWAKVKMNLSVPLYIDGRIGGENVVVYAAKPTNLDDIKGYEATLHTDDEGLDYPCTQRAIIDVGFAIASLITRSVRLGLTGGEICPVSYLDQANLNLLKGGWAE